jgi:MFS family permease
MSWFNFRLNKLGRSAISPNGSFNCPSLEAVMSIDSTGDDGKIKTMDDQQLKPRSRGKTIILMVALNMALFLAALDTVIITTALPTIATIFEISDSGYAWIGSAYLLTNAAFVPFWGKISDVFGRKPILMVSNLIFMAGSIISAKANSANMLIAGRAVQGLGGGGIVILVNICIGDLFSLRYVSRKLAKSRFTYSFSGCEV